MNADRASDSQDVAKAAVKSSFAAKAANKRRLEPVARIEPPKPKTAAQLLEEMLRTMNLLLEETRTQKSEVPLSPASVRFEITERDENGRIKSFKVGAAN